MPHRGILALGVAVLVVTSGDAVRVAAQAGQTPRPAAPRTVQRTQGHAPNVGASKACLECHESMQPGIVAQWRGSGHARAAVVVLNADRAEAGRADAFSDYGATIAVIVSPRDCARCHRGEDGEFEASHHAKAGNILASLDNYLAETVEGARAPSNPTRRRPVARLAPVNGMASVQVGCQQCHGAKDRAPGEDGDRHRRPLSPAPTACPRTPPHVAHRARQRRRCRLGRHLAEHRIGRLNLDGSRGSCTACHSRHDFSPGAPARELRQVPPRPHHPQSEIYEESKHGIAYRDLRDKMNLDAKRWVLGKDYSAAADLRDVASVGDGKRPDGGPTTLANGSRGRTVRPCRWRWTPTCPNRRHRD